MPKFYLKAFKSNPKRIHLYNLRGLQAIADVSLRDQCYGRYFYDPEGEAEKLLGIMEDECARIFASIRRNRKLPPTGSSEERFVYMFVAFQALRTEKMADQFAQQFSNASDDIIALGEQLGQRVTVQDVDQVLGKPENPALMSLFLANSMYKYMLDLRSQLVATKQLEFITSDNPAFRYNQYCQDGPVGGVIGAKKKGLQIFLPISPEMCLILYDGATYKCVRGSSRREAQFIKEHDAHSLNLLQIIAAHDNVYFSDWSQRAYIARSLRKVHWLRNDYRGESLTFVNRSDEHEAWLGFRETIPDIALDLHCLRIRKKALKIPVLDRHKYSRAQYASDANRGRPPAELDRDYVKFARGPEDDVAR